MHLFTTMDGIQCSTVDPFAPPPPPSFGILCWCNRIKVWCHMKANKIERFFSFFFAGYNFGPK